MQILDCNMFRWTLKIALVSCPLCSKRKKKWKKYASIFIITLQLLIQFNSGHGGERDIEHGFETRLKLLGQILDRDRSCVWSNNCYDIYEHPARPQRYHMAGTLLDCCVYRSLLLHSLGHRRRLLLRVGA